MSKTEYIIPDDHLRLVEEAEVNVERPDNGVMEGKSVISASVKRKIEHVVNVFETGIPEGNYGSLVKMADYFDPETATNIVQITYGRSQTTEFGNLKALVQDYIARKGLFATQLARFVDHIGKKPSLADQDDFCFALKRAGNGDAQMKTCQDAFFDSKYYMPAYSWFTVNGFTMPLSLLVIYDSYIHSGGILAFLRKRFAAKVPAAGGDEKEWIISYIAARREWLAHHSNPLLRKTVYRTNCFAEQIAHNNWDMSKVVMANGTPVV
jgi:chitosanase